MVHRSAAQSTRMCSSSRLTSTWKPLTAAAAGRPARAVRRLKRTHAIEEKRDTSESQAQSSPDMLSSEQLQKLAELRRQRAEAAPQPSSNIVQGALEEAQLIAWPTPGKALVDTVLVLAIVAATGTMLFGLNVLLADASGWWYSR
eukprot:GHRR01003604.1.p1 GENE.GHRR01003604.1~~GHRR01003604.1.p1  ORF type:complete len:145 (+),score=51.66 GHRR01003604.1:329-763(+)